MSNLLDKIIEYFSPATAVEREAMRQQLRYYQAGEVNRFNGTWIPTQDFDQENADKGERNLVKARARWLERNSDVANAAISAITRNVVGIGIKPQARTGNEDINTRIEECFKRWCRPKRCDIREQQSFVELQKMILQRVIVDGEILVKLVTTEDKDSPLKLQAIRSDLLDSVLSSNPENGKVIRSGIELDESLKPLAYWIEQKTPDGYVVLDSKRVPANELLHIWDPLYPDQIRGISKLGVSVKRIKDLDEYLDAETVAAKIAACFSIIITKPNLGVGVAKLNKKTGGLRDAEGKPISRVRPGMILQGEDGATVTPASPGRSATTASEYTNIHQRLIGSGQGLSYEILSRDFNKSSYSAARQGNLEDQKTFQPIQNWLIEHFCIPVYEAWLDRAVLTGEIVIPDYETNRERYVRADWIAPGWQSIDPHAEIQADVISMQNGTLTLAQQCAAHGYDWQEQLSQIAREKEFAERLGLTLNIHTPESVQAAESNHNGGNTNE